MNRNRTRCSSTKCDRVGRIAADVLPQRRKRAAAASSAFRYLVIERARKRAAAWRAATPCHSARVIQRKSFSTSHSVAWRYPDFKPPCLHVSILADGEAAALVGAGPVWCHDDRVRAAAGAAIAAAIATIITAISAIVVTISAIVVAMSAIAMIMIILDRRHVRLLDDCAWNLCLEGVRGQ